MTLPFGGNRSRTHKEQAGILEFEETLLLVLSLCEDRVHNLVVAFTGRRDFMFRGDGNGFLNESWLIGSGLWFGANGV